jgi:hypothetical protein
MHGRTLPRRHGVENTCDRRHAAAARITPQGFPSSTADDRDRVVAAVAVVRQRADTGELALLACLATTPTFDLAHTPLAKGAKAWPAGARMDPVDRANLTITGRHHAVTGSHVTVENDVLVIVTQAFGPRGDNLVGISDATFDGYPAVTIGIRAMGQEGLVHLSPLHGDGRKTLSFDIAAGTRCELFCPVSRQPLDLVGEVGDGSEARYYAIYLTTQLSQGSMVMVSDLWGHYHSRIIDDFELISAWATHHD